MKRLASLAIIAALALPVSSLASAQDRAAPPAGAGQQRGWGHRGGPGGPGGPGGRGHGPFSPERVEHKLQMLTIMLRLDANQQRMVREIAAQVVTEMRAAHDAAPPPTAGTAPNRDARRAARQAIFERAFERVDAILSTQQREIFDRMREVFRARRGGEGHGPREGRQGARGQHSHDARAQNGGRARS